MIEHVAQVSTTEFIKFLHRTRPDNYFVLRDGNVVSYRNEEIVISIETRGTRRALLRAMEKNRVGARFLFTADQLRDTLDSQARQELE